MERGASFGTGSSQRHYGLDWLRIAAFALLIVYHIGMVFSPWHWVIKTPHSYPALIAPMALLTPWRLALLFAVSGYASRKLFEKSGDAANFARLRARRLLIPLAFGMTVLVPIEMWVRVLETGYPHGYLHFWALDYWRVGDFYGRSFPSWEHLWFVAYLATYTMVLAALLAWAPRGFERAAERIMAWLAVGHRLLWAPVAALVTAKLALLFLIPERQGLTTDWQGHCEYLPIFLFGFWMGARPTLWPPLARQWRLALLGAGLAGAVIVAIEINYPGDHLPPHMLMALNRAARVAMAWWMTLGLFHIADTWWNHDHRWRATLAEAVFPFYIVHHPAIVLVTWYTLPLGLGPWSEFLLLFLSTLGACLATYWIGRRIRWFRPLIGLAPPKRQRPVAPVNGIPAASNPQA